MIKPNGGRISQNQIRDSSSSNQVLSSISNFEVEEAHNEDSNDFLAGCYFEETPDMLRLEQERLKEANDQTRDHKDWPWLATTRIYKGVTLKHTIDQQCSYEDIKCVKGSPTTHLKSNYLQFLNDGRNIKLVPEPAVFPSLPAQWMNWSNTMSTEDVRNTKLKHEYRIDLRHAADPAEKHPMQPAETHNINHNQLYLISPRLVIQTLTSYGQDYTFCDRFNGEHKTTFTQFIEPGAMQETDPVKRLQMFSVEIKVECRLHFVKSCFPMQGKISEQNQKQIIAAYTRGYDLLGDVLETTIKQRLYGQLYPPKQKQQKALPNKVPENKKQIKEEVKKDVKQRSPTKVKTSPKKESERKRSENKQHLNSIKASMTELAQSSEQRMNQLQTDVGSLKSSIGEMATMFKLLFMILMMIISIYFFTVKQGCKGVDCFRV